MEITDRVKIFTYGTLKKGFFNHFYMGKDAKFIMNARLDGYALYSYNGSYPMASELPGMSVKGEIWEISMEAFMRIDSMECEAGYDLLKGPDGVYSFIVPPIRMWRVIRGKNIEGEPGQEWTKEGKVVI